jgi:hypothetical protein
MAEVLGTWAGLDRRVGAVRRWLLDKPAMEPEALAEVRARLERVLATLVADGRVRIERPRVVDDLRGLLAEIDRRAALPGSQARHDSRYAKRAVEIVLAPHRTGFRQRAKRERTFDIALVGMRL